MGLWEAYGGGSRWRHHNLHRSHSGSSHFAPRFGLKRSPFVGPRAIAIDARVVLPQLRHSHPTHSAVGPVLVGVVGALVRSRAAESGPQILRGPAGATILPSLCPLPSCSTRQVVLPERADKHGAGRQHARLLPGHPARTSKLHQNWIRLKAMPAADAESVSPRAAQLPAQSASPRKAESASPRAAQLQAQSASPRKAESVSAIATTEDPLFRR